MLTLEERILSEILVSRRIISQERLERRARELVSTPGGGGLLTLLVDSGDVDEPTARQAEAEAREIGLSLAPEGPATRTLGDFTLGRELGRGGMGIVYEARQESLGRRVAVKVLPAGAALDERLTIRFLREARAAAQLSHPGIVPVFASGRAEGVLYFAMELVEGRPLSETIERGPLDPEHAARIAADVARALHHAHEAGLVHRDVKPENILLEPGGRCRLTDFGLVRDLAASAITRSQYVLGTPAYAAPEQARGEPADARSDVYGLGAVLYAMLAGRAPYTGEVPASVLGRVLTEDPPRLAERRPDLPGAVIAICERAMARDRANRYPTAEALAEDLGRFLRGEPVAVSVAKPSDVRRPRWGTWAALAAALLVAVGSGLYLLLGRSGTALRQADSGSGARPALGLLRGTYARVPTPPGGKSYPDLSPDGRFVAYGAARPDGAWDIRLQGVGGDAADSWSFDAIPSSRPRFAPDGTSVAFCGGERTLEVVDRATRERRVLADRCGLLSWSPDGARIAFTDDLSPGHVPRALGGVDPVHKLYVLDVETGASGLVTSLGAAHPSWSPGGRRIAFVSATGGRQDVWTIPPGGGEPVRVTDDEAADWFPVWSADGTFLYFGSARAGRPDLWRVPIDESSGRVQGEAEPLSRGLMAAPFYLTAARRADVLAFGYWTVGEHVFRLPFDPASGNTPGPPERVTTAPPAREGWPAPAPGGGAVALAFALEGYSMIALLRPGSPEFVPLTGGGHRDHAPRWSPDGSRIAFDSDRSGKREIWVVDSEGGEPIRLTDTAEGEAVVPVWSPSGDRIAYGVPGRGAFIFELRADRTAAPQALPAVPDTTETFEPWSWSADGRRIAGSAAGIVVYSIAGNRFERLSGTGRRPVWLPSSRALLFEEGSAIRLLDLRTGSSRVVFDAAPHRLGTGLAVSGDGRSIYGSLVVSDEDLILIDLGAGTARDVTE